MKLSKEQLELRDGITKEWLITNGIGGYASSSVLGINTWITSSFSYTSSKKVCNIIKS